MELNTQKQALLKLRNEYKDLLTTNHERDESDTLSVESGADSDVPTHDADIATETFERERDLAFDTDYQVMLNQIDRALAKIDDGTYGICERCGKRIPDERLEAEPYALLCIEDQAAEEDI